MIYFSFLKDVFSGIGFWVNSFFVQRVKKYHFLVTFLVSGEKSTVVLIIFPLQCHFFLAAFKIFPFSLSLAFKTLIMICVGLIWGGCFVWGSLTLVRGFQGGSVVEHLPASAGYPRDMGLIPEWGRSPGVRNGNPPTPVFLPGKFHGQRSLVGYSP